MNDRIPSIGVILDYPELIHSEHFSDEERDFIEDLISQFSKMRREADAGSVFDSLPGQSAHFRKLSIPGVNC